MKIKRNKSRDNKEKNESLNNNDESKIFNPLMN